MCDCLGDIVQQKDIGKYDDGASFVEIKKVYATKDASIISLTLTEAIYGSRIAKFDLINCLSFRNSQAIGDDYNPLHPRVFEYFLNLFRQKFLLIHSKLCLGVRATINNLESFSSNQGIFHSEPGTNLTIKVEKDVNLCFIF